MAHFLCHLGCSHFGALLLDFHFTENTVTLWKNFICNTCLWGMVVFLPGGMLGPGIVRLR